MTTKPQRPFTAFEALQRLPQGNAGPVVQNYLPVQHNTPPQGGIPQLPGTGPMPTPVTDGQPYEIVIPDPPQVLTGQTLSVADGNPILLARAFYGRPRDLTVYVGIDPLKCPSQMMTDRWVKATIAANPNQEVCVVADITWGAGGITFEATVNIPIGEIVQIPLVAQSVDVSARLTIPGNIGPRIPNLIFDVRLATPVPVTSFIAEGVLGYSTAKRRTWAELLANGTANFEIPSFSKSLQIIGGPNIKYAWQVTAPGMIDIPDAVPTPIAQPPAGSLIPIPNSAKALFIFNTNGAAAEAFEAQFNLF